MSKGTKMNLKIKLFLKTLAILTPIEFLWFAISMVVAYYFNDFLGRSIAGVGFIIVPLIGSYILMIKELDNDEELKYKKFMAKLEGDNKKNGRSNRK